MIKTCLCDFPSPLKTRSIQKTNKEFESISIIKITKIFIPKNQLIGHYVIYLSSIIFKVCISLYDLREYF